MRILLVTHYYWPEVGAPQARLGGVVKCLTGSGHKVHVLTGIPSYPTGVVPDRYRGRGFAREWHDGAQIVRSWTFAAANRGFARRLTNHLSTAFTSLPAALAVGHIDVVIAETPPLFTAASAAAVAKLKRARLVLSVADLWPDVAVSMGALSHPALVKPALALEKGLYAEADHIVTPAATISKHLREQKNVPASKVSHIPSGVDLDSFQIGSSPLAKTLIPEDAFVVMFVGTLGPSHGLKVVMDAARHLTSKKQILFVFIGEGPDRAELEEAARTNRLDNVLFLGQRPNDEIPGFLARANVCLNWCADHAILEDAMPRKTGEYLASGKPLVMAASRDAVEKHEVGMWVSPSDSAGLADALRYLFHNPDECDRFGANARIWAREEFSLAAGCERYVRLLNDVVG
jgi:glycosyltransferase involved in cell wall biosynthesis